VWLCEHLGCHFSSQFWWFVGTDVAVYFIFKYYIASHASSSQSSITEQQPTYIELERPLTQVQIQRPVYKFVYTR